MAPIDQLVGGGGSIEQRLTVTLALLVGLVLVGALARAFRRRLDLEGYAARGANVVVALGVFAAAMGVAGALYGMWGAEPAVQEALSTFDVGSPVFALSRVLLSVAIVVGTYLLTGLIERFIYELSAERGSITKHQRELAYRTTQVSAYALAGLVVFTVWGVNLGGLLVGAGFLGIVVGLAARQTLGSLIAGFVLMFARPFEIGDWVQIGDREGIVTEISIVNTRVQTFDGEYAMIPNDTVAASEVVNRTRKGRLRLTVGVGVDYDTDVEDAMEVAVTAMRDVEDVLAVPQPRAVATGFGPSSIELSLRFWIDKPSARRKWRAQTAVVAAVKSAFEEAGVKIPFPQRELSGRAETGGFQVEGPAFADEAGQPEGGAGDE